MRHFHPQFKLVHSRNAAVPVPVLPFIVARQLTAADTLTVCRIPAPRQFIVTRTGCLFFILEDVIHHIAVVPVQGFSFSNASECCSIVQRNPSTAVPVTSVIRQL